MISHPHFNKRNCSLSIYLSLSLSIPSRVCTLYCSSAKLQSWHSVAPRLLVAPCLFVHLPLYYKVYTNYSVLVPPYLLTVLRRFFYGIQYRWHVINTVYLVLLRLVDWQRFWRVTENACFALRYVLLQIGTGNGRFPWIWHNRYAIKEENEKIGTNERTSSDHVEAGYDVEIAAWKWWIK